MPFVEISEKNEKSFQLKKGDFLFARSGTIGRLKIEKRPFLQICWENNNDKPSNIFLQQAETVKLVCPNNQIVAVTEIKPGDKILTYNNEGQRHIGMKISSDVEER